MVTQQQIDAWKKKHGDVYEITVEDKKAYIHKPTRKVLGLAMTMAQQDPLKMAETILVNCWLGGDEEVRTDDAMFMGVQMQLEQLIEIKAAEIKKL